MTRLMHTPHGCVDSRFRVETGNGEVLKGSKTKHSRMLQNRILLVNLRSPAVKKTDQVSDRKPRDPKSGRR